MMEGLMKEVFEKKPEDTNGSLKKQRLERRPMGLD
jgi:hypothetical protein